MCENWEDWDDDDIVIPVLNVPNKEQIKQLEERKIMEESEITLMKDFFDDKNNINNNTINNNTINNNNNNNNNNKGTERKPKISKQKENELKQRELSIKLKLKKKQEIKHSETFGEFIFDEYDKYDKFDDY